MWKVANTVRMICLSDMEYEQQLKRLRLRNLQYSRAEGDDINWNLCVVYDAHAMPKKSEWADCAADQA